MSDHTNRNLRLLTSTALSSTFEMRISVSKFALKQWDKLPKPIAKRVNSWIRLVQIHGLMEVRKISGYHDEPLKGSRDGQRSIRLSRGWRLIYEELESENRTQCLIVVLEVNKHAY